MWGRTFCHAVNRVVVGPFGEHRIRFPRLEQVNRLAGSRSWVETLVQVDFLFESFELRTLCLICEKGFERWRRWRDSGGRIRWGGTGGWK